MCNQLFKALAGAGILALCAQVSPITAQNLSNHYAVILQDAPVADRFQGREAIHTQTARDYEQQVLARQAALKSELQTRKFAIAGSVSRLLNAVFVVTTPDRVAELRSLPGVLAVQQMRFGQRQLNAATQLVNAPAAWNALGGAGNAGAGMKIAILDTGIDNTHPMFQDNSLSVPSGFPKCDSDNQAVCSSFTNNKVIVARSYVKMISTTVSPGETRPDDYTPRDRSGHGTATASCAAGEQATTPAINASGSGNVVIQGMAPKAWLGNYKVYGTPYVNDYPTEDVYIKAIEDAQGDGMDVASFSSGLPALTGPVDVGAVCGNPAGVACDLLATAFENAVKSGMIVVASAGNGNYTGSNSGAPNYLPTYSSIATPADAPDVIAVGASTNSHYFTPLVDAAESGLASNLYKIPGEVPANSSLGQFGSETATLIDAAALGNANGCNAYPPFSLAGDIVLVVRDPANCGFDVKVSNAQTADAIGVVIYDNVQEPLFQIGYQNLSSSIFIPANLISNSDGLNLKSWIDANPGQQVIVNQDGLEVVDSADENELTSFSSIGPTTGPLNVKPDLVAPGAEPSTAACTSGNGNCYYGGIYMAMQNYDLYGDVYSSDRYGAADGTSFSAPIVAGAAALVKQAHPGWNYSQIRSALIDSTSQAITQDIYGDTVDVIGVGAGLLNAGAAVASTVSVSPATLAMGYLTTKLPPSAPLVVTNNGNSTVNLTMASAATSGETSTATVGFDKTSLSLAPGGSGTVNVTLTGAVPTSGFYSGAITLTGSGVSLRVPYLYVVGSGAIADIIPINAGFDGTVGQTVPSVFGQPSVQVVDDFGVPVANTTVTWTAGSGVSISAATSTTNQYGIATINVTGVTQTGSTQITASAGGQSLQLPVYARNAPAIRASSGVENAASFQANSVAPGSYIAIFGTDLSDPGYIDSVAFPRLPLQIDEVQVSFDAANGSFPARMLYVSPTQVNVQVPWELQGQSSAQMKVTLEYSYGSTITVPIASYAPAFFQANGIAAARDENNKVVTTSNPVQNGHVVEFFLNGLGPVTNQPETGDPAPATTATLAKTTSTPIVMIGSQSATVHYSGLAPGYPGLYQVNATVPAGLSGSQTVTIQIGGVTSPTVTIPVK